MCFQDLLFCMSPKRMKDLPIMSSSQVGLRFPKYSVATIFVAINQEILLNGYTLLYHI